MVTLVKIQHRWPEIKLEQPLKIIMFLSPMQMVEVKINPVEVNTDLSKESKPLLPPEVNSQILILIFPHRRQQHTHFNEGYNRRYSPPPPTFPSPGFNNTMASDAVGRSIIQLAENQSRSLDFILAGQQSQMDAYKEMTCSNSGKGG